MSTLYDKRDYYSILELLKEKASDLSGGRWTDFSDGDIGTVLLKVMAMLGDMNNFHIDKGINELYLNDAVDKSSILSLCKLIGYEPRHYQSAHTVVTIHGKEGEEVADGTVLGKGTVVMTQDKDLAYTTLDDYIFLNNICKPDFYEGTIVSKVYKKEDINLLGQIFLEDYQIGTNTVRVKVGTKDYSQVNDVRYSTGGLEFSIHMSEEKYLYIQFPSYWRDYISDTSDIKIDYLITNGIEGRVAEGKLVQFDILEGNLVTNSVLIAGNTQSVGGYDPETVSEIKESAPQYARTMDTIVTLNDFKDVMNYIAGISDIVALDYNNTDSGLTQPDDAYKVLVYVLPDEGNSIIKPENEWTTSDKNLLTNYGIQPLTELGEKIRDYIDERRLASLDVEYVNVEILNPEIVVDVYMDKDNIYYNSASELVRDFIVETYKRGNTKIGQNFYSSVLGANILRNCPYIEYCEVTTPISKIEVNSKQFINILAENIQVNVNSI